VISDALALLSRFLDDPLVDSARATQLGNALGRALLEDLEFESTELGSELMDFANALTDVADVQPRC
jgi:hypothetical protein